MMVNIAIDGEPIDKIIDDVALLPFAYHREICQYIYDNISELDCRIYISDIIKVFAFFSPSDRSEVFDIIADFVRTSRLDDYTRYLEIINSILSFRQDMQQRTHEYLANRLIKEPRAVRAKALAHDIKKYLHCFDIFDEEHNLPSTAIMVLFAQDDISVAKNPYTLFQKIEDNKILDIEPFAEKNIIGEQVLFFPAAILSSSNSFILRQELLSVTQEPYKSSDLTSIIDGFKARFEASKEALSTATEVESPIEAYVEEISTYGVDEICSNMKDPFFSQLLNAPYEEHISCNKAYLCAVVAFLKSLNADISEGALLSSQEEALVKLSSSIRNCSIGKAEGLVLAYNLLPSEFKIPSLKDQLVERAKKAKEFILKRSETFVIDMLSSDGPFIRSLTGSSVVDP